MNAEVSLAVHGLVYLLHTQRTTSSEELAGNICTNPARVRKVMAKLKKGGLVDSSEGKGSGYHTIANAREISICQVLQALQEDVVVASWHSGAVDMDCLIASGMGEIMNRIYGEMDALCKEHLGKITIGKIHDEIFDMETAHERKEPDNR